MDYKAEVSKIEAGRQRLPWWNPTVGVHEVKFLSDGEEYESRLVIRGEEQILDKVRYEIEVNGERYSWGITKGRTTNSLWGQLCVVGAKWGTLKDKTIKLMVKEERRGGRVVRSYTVVEAVEIMQKEKEAKKKEKGSASSPASTIVEMKNSNFIGSKKEIMEKLGINEDEFKALRNLGAIRREGTKFRIV